MRKDIEKHEYMQSLGRGAYVLELSTSMRTICQNICVSLAIQILQVLNQPEAAV